MIGFAAETNDVEANAKAKLARKGCDWIVANDVSVGGRHGRRRERRGHRHAPGGIERWERMAKGAVARRLAERIAEELK